MMRSIETDVWQFNTVSTALQYIYSIISVRQNVKTYYNIVCEYEMKHINIKWILMAEIYMKIKSFNGYRIMS